MEDEKGTRKFQQHNDRTVVMLKPESKEIKDETKRAFYVTVTSP